MAKAGRFHIQKIRGPLAQIGRAAGDAAAVRFMRHAHTKKLMSDDVTRLIKSGE